MGIILEKVKILMENPAINLSFIVLIIVLIIAFFVNVIKLKKIEKRYNNLMIKLGNGNNLEGMLNNYIQLSNKVSDENEEIKKYCTVLNNKIEQCIQKVGIVRYSAYHDTGSDLSYAVALLNNKNSGIILNGIYSRETSNTYAKPVINGESTYTLSKEEEEALEKAVNS